MVENGSPTGGASRRTEHTVSPESVRALSGQDGPPREIPPERFLSTEHLSTEAVAAYVDEALPPTGVARARSHLQRCALCRREVAEQRDARQALRGSGPIRMPEDLRSRLAGLPDGPPPGPSGRTAPHEPPRGLWQRLRDLFGGGRR